MISLHSAPKLSKFFIFGWNNISLVSKIPVYNLAFLKVVIDYYFCP